MQVDMHYYGTYAMAKAAGLNDEACKIIATSAEFVDDNSGHQQRYAKDNSHLHVTATAHHSVDKDNLDPDDQRLVWVPFHFLPGNEGDSYEERLICRKDSAIARQMLEHALSHADKPFACHLIGLTAHVYADTFAHYGFSGISSQYNYIDDDTIEFDSALPSDAKSYIMSKFSAFKRRISAEIAEELSRGLGHGAAHTYPDRPYLKWQFKYQDGRDSGMRSNPATFLEACEKIHDFFSRFAASNPQYKKREPTPFADMKEAIVHILHTCKKAEGRIEKWQGASSAGLLSPDGARIPEYDAEIWLNQLESIDDMSDGSQVLEMDVFKFLQAAAIHRSYILRDLLPSHGLLVR